MYTPVAGVNFIHRAEWRARRGKQIFQDIPDKRRVFWPQSCPSVLMFIGSSAAVFVLVHGCRDASYQWFPNIFGLLPACLKDNIPNTPHKCMCFYCRFTTWPPAWIFPWISWINQLPIWIFPSPFLLDHSTACSGLCTNIFVGSFHCLLDFSPAFLVDLSTTADLSTYSKKCFCPLWEPPW